MPVMSVDRIQEIAEKAAPWVRVHQIIPCYLQEGVLRVHLLGRGGAVTHQFTYAVAQAISKEGVTAHPVGIQEVAVIVDPAAYKAGISRRLA